MTKPEIKHIIDVGEPCCEGGCKPPCENAETKQPEWAMEIEAALRMSGVLKQYTKEETIEVITANPAIKELVEAAMQLLTSIDTPAEEHTPAFVYGVGRAISALKPFKGGE